MKKIAVIAATLSGILLVGYLVFPFDRHTSGRQTAASEQVATLSHLTKNRVVADSTTPPHIPQVGSSSPAILVTADPFVSIVHSEGSTGVEVSTQELAARRERSEETFRLLQKSFDARNAKDAAFPRKKSEHTRGGMGTPLVCEPNQHGKAIIHDPIPFGFIFDPKEYPNGRIELRNLQSVPLVVTVRGDQQVLVNGQPATTGVEYPIDEGLEITSPGQVRIHVAPGGAAMNSLDGRG